MSMLGNAGSSAAANDIMNYIEKLMKEESVEGDSKERRLLSKVWHYAKQVRETADSGWY